MDQKEYVVLAVTDTGTGIPKKDGDHIFEPFYTKKVMGRSQKGLGLAVVCSLNGIRARNKMIRNCHIIL